MLVYCKAPVYCCLSNYVSLICLPMTSLNRNAKGAKELYLFDLFSRLLTASITHHQPEMRCKWHIWMWASQFSLWITDVSRTRNFGILASHTHGYITCNLFLSNCTFVSAVAELTAVTLWLQHVLCFINNQRLDCIANFTGNVIHLKRMNTDR